MPADWPGPLTEWLVYAALLRLGKVPGLDFSYQSSMFGGRVERGGLVIDFLFPDLGLAINPVGEYWHRGAQSDAQDLMERAALAGQGITLIFIDEQDLYTDALFYVREALEFRDHSRLARG